MTDQIAIKVDGVSKTFRLPLEKNSSIKSAVVNFYKRNKIYEEQRVLNDISFEIKKGEFFGIVGRNGSGKSTLLKLLAGIYAPDKGNILVNGKLTPFIELGVGFNPELTGRENVYLNGALLGFNHKEVDEMYDDIVTFSELQKFMNQKLKNYSSGMQVRLAFSIAIRADTAILLFDEVLAVGDENFQKKCLKVFRDLKDAKKTIILVSHSTVDIERFCDRVLVIDKGKQLGVFDAHKAVSLYKEINFEPITTTVTKKQKTSDRWGSKEIKIGAVVVGDGGRVKTNEQLLIKLSLKTQLPIAKNRPLLLGLAIYDDTGVQVSGPNSLTEQLVFLAGKKTMDLTYIVARNPLNEGTYKLTVAVFDQSQAVTYDYWTDAKIIEVTSDKEYFGKVVLDGKWS